MADIDLKTETPDTTLPTDGFLFGADSQSAASPSVYPVANAITTFSGNLQSSDLLAWNSDTILARRAAANLQLGAADAAAPVAQTLSVQSVVAGTTNTAGANLTIAGSQGTGTGAGGSIVFQVAPAGASGTAQNALVDALTIQSDGVLVANRLQRSSGTLLIGANEQTVLFSASTAGAFGMCAVRASSSAGSALAIRSAFGLAWVNGSNPATDTIHLRLLDDAADTLAQRRGTNAQAFRVYNTYTSATNFERAKIAWASNVLQIGTEKGANGGTARALELQTDGTTRLTIAAASGDVTTTGSVTTAAPTGGTAAAWKLGTVASVTPTSPDRTIEVDIGGTIYYLHAKTTND
jgi:hypothetical protein